MSLSISEAAIEQPNRLALIASTERLTFSELADRVHSRIEALAAEGLDGTASLPRTAVVATNDLPTACTILALIEMGEPFVILHPRLTDRERSAILEEIRPKLVLDRTTAFAERHTFVRRPIPDERCLAILHTSGTTGRPKGAMLSRRAFIASAEASAKNLGWLEHDRWLACLPLAHVGALSIVARCLLARRTIVIDDASNIARTIADEAVTIASLVPTLLRKLLDQNWSAPETLRAILLGGAGASATLIEEARVRSLPVLTTYGLTEACSQVTTQRYGTPPSPEVGSGEPVSGFEVRIEDDEIQIRGPALMSGYFPIGAHPDPFLPDGFLRTGDLGAFDPEGRLHLFARRTDLIVTGGENVYPSEVEQALLAIPGITGACVFGMTDETWGQIVAAALIADSPPADAAIAQHLAASLASFKRPRRIAFLGQLPERSGKIDRDAARREAEPLLRPLPSRE